MVLVGVEVGMVEFGGTFWFGLLLRFVVCDIWRCARG